MGLAQLTSESFPARKEALKTMALLEMGRSREPAGYGVTVVGHELKFSAERDLWYADVEISAPVERFPFLRLGLVRFQPHSAQGCHVSRVDLPDPVQLLPRRTLVATISGTAREFLNLTVRGRACATRSSRRSTTGGCSTAPSQPPLEITEPTAPATGLSSRSSATRRSKLAEGAPAQGGAARRPRRRRWCLAEYLAGRIVVREHQQGRNILTGADESRVIYVETFERNLPPNPTLSLSATTITQGGTVKVTWSGATGATTTDWIGVFPAGADNHAHKAYLYTDGKPAGSLDFTLNPPPGFYDFRFLPNDGYDLTAVSAKVTVGPAPPTSES